MEVRPSAYLSTYLHVLERRLDRRAQGCSGWCQHRRRDAHRERVRRRRACCSCGGGGGSSLFKRLLCMIRAKGVASQRSACGLSTAWVKQRMGYSMEKAWAYRTVDTHTRHTLDKEVVERNLLLRGNDAERALVELHRELLGRRGLPVNHLHTAPPHTCIQSTFHTYIHKCYTSVAPPPKKNKKCADDNKR